MRLVLFILCCFLLCAMCCGVNVNGKHYGMSCSSRGVTVDGLPASSPDAGK